MAIATPPRRCLLDRSGDGLSRLGLVVGAAAILVDTSNRGADASVITAVNAAANR